jgi:hypothetical protein
VAGTDPSEPRGRQPGRGKLKPAIIGAVATIIAGIVPALIIVFGQPGAAPEPGPTKTVSSIPSINVSTPPVRIGKPVGANKPIDLLNYYSPSGFMGDIGDITKGEEPGNHLVRMTYVAKGNGPHEWDNKYSYGKLNPKPSWFAGIMLLDGDWGQTRGAGYNLRHFTTISWEARSLSGNVFVQFVAGGANWMWDEKTGTKVGAPYPDSLPNLQLGEEELTGQWQHFEFPLNKNATPADLQAVVAPFGWIISLDSNEGDHGQPSKFVIEVRNISYE